MDLEQIIKRLEWLDDERRKDKLTIAMLEERLAGMENQLPALNKQIGDLASDVSRLTSAMTRFDQMDALLAQMRVDSARALEAAEKARAEREREMEKSRRADLESMTKSMLELRKGLEALPEVKKSLQARTEEEFRLSRQIEELEHKLYESSRLDDENRRGQRLLDEARKQDAKRLTDLQAEVSALRKRLDEQRGKVDLAADSVQKLNLRVNEIQSAENDRRQNQVSFIEKQNMLLVERERTWKDWQTRFDSIAAQSLNLDTQLQSIEATHRSVKRAQEAFDEITQRFERRINEITEMQRLTEERFRQDWANFKADDQKRWTNYTLLQEEQGREVTRQFERYQTRLVALEDLSQETRDLLQQVVEETQKRLQILLGVVRQSAEEFDRNLGNRA